MYSYVYYACYYAYHAYHYASFAYSYANHYDYQACDSDLKNHVFHIPMYQTPHRIRVCFVSDNPMYSNPNCELSLQGPR